MPRQATGRPNGRPPGRKNAATVERQRLETEAREFAFGFLTEDQIKSLTPRDIFRLVAHAAVRMQQIPLMLKAAADWAPYEHPKLTSTTLDATVRRTAADFTDEELLALAGTGMGGEGDDEASDRPN